MSDKYHHVEIFYVNDDGVAWFRVNNTFTATAHNIKRGPNSLKLGIMIATAEADWREDAFDMACARLRHGLALSRQPRPLRWLRRLLRKLGGEFVYDPE